eukprot:12883637-Prorocentrum_lima.AAC.1
MSKFASANDWEMNVAVCCKTLVSMLMTFACGRHLHWSIDMPTTNRKAVETIITDRIITTHSSDHLLPATTSSTTHTQ